MKDYKGNIGRHLKILIIVLAIAYSVNNVITPKVYCRFLYNMSYRDLKELLINDINFFCRKNFTPPKNINELIEYLEYIVDDANDNDLIKEDITLRRENLIKYLKKNRDKLYIKVLPNVAKDSAIFLFYNSKYLLDLNFEYPAVDLNNPNEASFDLYVCSFKDLDGNNYYNNNIADEIVSGIKRLNDSLIKEYLLKNNFNEKNLRKYPFIYAYKRNSLSNYLFDINLDTTWQHYNNVYHFLDSVATHNKLSSIITTCYHFEIE